MERDKEKALSDPAASRYLRPTFKSLTPRDPEYKEYLLGRFSETERAIPQSSLNQQTLNEVVTFEIKKIQDLEPAPLWKKLWLLFKPQTWLTVLVPLIVTAQMTSEAVFWSSVILGFELILLMTFVNWQADLADHLEGWDRFQNVSAPSVLQKGWMTGFQMRWASYGVLGMAVFIGIPLLSAFPWVLGPYAIVTLVILMLLPRWWRKSLLPGLTSFLIFVLAGPLLTIGVDLSFDGAFRWSSVFLGLAWGLWISYGRQQRIYTKQWNLRQKCSRYSFLGLGFDRSKALMQILIPIVPSLMILSLIFIRGGSAWFFPMVVVHSAFCFFETQLNEKIQSSVGSSLGSLQKLFDWHHYATSAVMILGAILWKTTH